MDAKLKNKIGWVLTGLIGVALLASAANKFRGGTDEFMLGIGFSQMHITAIAVLEIICALLMLIPQTNKLGFLLVTAYLGGAIAIELLSGQGILVGVLFQSINWIGHYLRRKNVFH